LYFLLKYALLPVLFTLTQVVLLLIISTFTRVQIQSNLGTTVPHALPSKSIPVSLFIVTRFCSFLDTSPAPELATNTGTRRAARIKSNTTSDHMKLVIYKAAVNGCAGMV
jgi:hypothetical protein